MATKRPAGAGGLRKRGATWQSTARDPRTGQQQWRTWPRTMTQRDVERSHAAWVADVVSGRAGDRRMTVAAFLDRWFATTEPNMHPSTAVHRRHDVGVLKDRIGHIRLADLNTLDVIDLLDRFAAEGLAASTIKNRRTTLGMAMRDAVAWGMRPTNPVSAARSPRAPRTEREVPTTEQVRKLIELETDPMWRCMWWLLAGTGMRCGEALALRFGDFSLEQPSVVVARTMTRDRNGRVMVGDTTKSKKPRRVGMSEELAAEVRSWRAHCASVGLDRARPESHVFSGWASSGVVSYPALNRAWRSAARAAGISDKVTIHALRHWVASTLMAEGVPAQSISLSLGNSIMEIQNRYGVHAPPELAMAVVNRLPSLRAGGGA